MLPRDDKSQLGVPVPINTRKNESKLSRASNRTLNDPRAAHFTSPHGRLRTVFGEDVFQQLRSMVTFYDEIVPELYDFIIAQHVFFTGSAPLHLPNSHVNVSPKGLADATFTIVNPKCVWYQDSTGSGAETISHLYDNGRITIMFCSFGPEAKIVRLFGRGTVYEV
jgi:hypothetical protein